ncbi:uncharacterized protein JCM6883_005705 [Sporobolomyces salmoneus]|uniref:uncharacterized protein n=1 Tax=Sporobolomyces salmoneus TaxID=183962 RepID=UPI00317713E0
MSCLPPGACPPLPSASLSTSNSPDLVEDRFLCRELMEGFPVHRDACEWSKLRDLFAEKDAYVFTTWSGGVPIDEFIKISEIGFTKGVQIAHRVNGSTVDIAISGPGKGKRALGKLKATITQRFKMPCIDGKEGEVCEVDIDADCRLCFFLEKNEKGEWKNHFFKGIYERDRPHPIDPTRLPFFDQEKLASFPQGYRHLGYCQEVIAGYKVKRDLPGSRGKEHDEFYESFIAWLEGTNLEEMKIKLGV